MTWECPNCDRMYPDSGIGVPPEADAEDMIGCDECTIRVPENTLNHIYRSLVDACESASNGDKQTALSVLDDATKDLDELYAAAREAERLADSDGGASDVG